jgi:hypothetical protein
MQAWICAEPRRGQVGRDNEAWDVGQERLEKSKRQGYIRLNTRTMAGHLVDCCANGGVGVA